jgi:hypothetical protein
VGVAVQTPLGVAVRGLVAGQVPDDERLVARAGQEHVGAGRKSVIARLARRATFLGGHALLQRGSKGGNPARVALEGTTEYELLGHDCDEWLLLRMDVGALGC